MWSPNDESLRLAYRTSSVKYPYVLTSSFALLSISLVILVAVSQQDSSGITYSAAAKKFNRANYFTCEFACCKASGEIVSWISAWIEVSSTGIFAIFWFWSIKHTLLIAYRWAFSRFVSIKNESSNLVAFNVCSSLLSSHCCSVLECNRN